HEIQDVPVAPSARRRPRVLRPPRRASDGRHDRLRPRSVVPRLQLLQASPHSEEARPSGLPVLASPWSLVLRPWSLVLRPWSFVRGPSPVPGPWTMDGPRTVDGPGTKA